jgi:hypothetical protein
MRESIHVESFRFPAMQPNTQQHVACEGGSPCLILSFLFLQKVAGSRPDEIFFFFSIYLILLATLGPGVHSASSINECQEQKNNVSGEYS